MRNPLHRTVQNASPKLSRVSTTGARAWFSESLAVSDSVTSLGFHIQKFLTKVKVMTLAGAGAGGDSKTLCGWGGRKMTFEESLPDVTDM